MAGLDGLVAGQVAARHVSGSGACRAAIAPVTAGALVTVIKGALPW